MRVPRRVLVLEDDRMIAQLLYESLDENRYEVLVATCGAEALEIARCFPGGIDAIVSDVLLGEERGHRIAAGVRESSPKAALVLTSGYPLAVLNHEGILLPQHLADQQTAFVEKPFLPATITASIEKILTAIPCSPVAAQGSITPERRRAHAAAAN